MKQRKLFLEKTKEKLLTRQQEILEEIKDLAHEKTGERQVMDSADQALSISIEKLQSSLQQTEIDELHSIDDSLERLKKGEYGLCIDCGELISQQRLEYYPYAARCIVCQETAEASP